MESGADSFNPIEIEEVNADSNTELESETNGQVVEPASQNEDENELALNDCDLKVSAANLLKETTTDNLNAMTNMLATVAKPASYESVVELQNKSKELEIGKQNAGEQLLRTFLQLCPKEVQLILIICVAFIVAFIAYTSQLFILVVSFGACIGIYLLFNYLQNKHETIGNNEILELQLKSCIQHNMASQDIVEKLAGTAKQMQIIRQEGIIKIRELEARVAQIKMTAVQEMHMVEKECQRHIKELEEDGMSGREEIRKQKEETIAHINAEALKMKAEIERKKENELKNIELEKTKFEKDIKLKETKIESETKQFIANKESEAKHAQLRHAAEQETAKRAHEQQLKSNELRTQQENLRLQIQKDQAIATAQIQQVLDAQRQETERIRIQQQGQTERTRIENERSCIIC